MRRNQIPRRPRRKQPLPLIRRHDAVARRLVRVPCQHVGVKVAGAVVHGPSGGGLGRERAAGAAALDAGRGAEDLVLRAHFLEVALEALVLGARVVLGLFEGREAVLEVLYMALLALAECALTVAVSTGMTNDTTNVPIRSYDISIEAPQSGASRENAKKKGQTHAARFWAFRLD